MTVRAVVGFGSNLGGRLETMRRALTALARLAHVEATSRVFETAPVGPAQPDYLNAAALVTWDGTPEALMEALLAVEAELGRVRAQRNGPRTIDLDVLWMDGVRLDTPSLVVPHPRLRERAFAVMPLLDVAPGARDPVTGEPYVAPPGEAGAIRDTGDRL